MECACSDPAAHVHLPPMDPLILSQRAVRRLGLLVTHSADDTRSMAAVLAAAGCGTSSSRAPVSEVSGLPAALLRRPVELSEPPTEQSGGWQAARDVLAEVAVTIQTLRELQVGLVAPTRRTAAPPSLHPSIPRRVPPPGPTSRCPQARWWSCAMWSVQRLCHTWRACCRCRR